MQKLVRSLGPWMPAIVWALVISGASTDTFSSEHTSRFIVPLLHWLLPHAGADTLDLLHLIIRRLGHVTEYSIFSLLLFRGARGKHSGWQLRWAIAALSIAAVYSALDEFHQSFVPSRTASPWDSLLDTLAAAAAQFALWLWFRSLAQCETSTPGHRIPGGSD